mgnify:CR=1 FL=1
MLYFTNFFFLQFLLYLSLVTYFFFKLSAQSANQPKLNTTAQNLFYNLFIIIILFLLFLYSFQPVLGLDTLLSSVFELSLVQINLIFFFAAFVFIFIELLRTSNFSQQLNSLLMFIILFLFFFFFAFFFSITNHFELICIFEYLNALLVLYILISTPTIKPNIDAFKSSIGKNTKYLTSYFFLPALINYFFLIFIISIFLFYFYIYLLVDLSFTSNFAVLSISLKNPIFFTFFLIFLIFKLGIAPLHFWKLEIFESFRLVHFSFFSTLYFVFSLIFFEFITTKMSILSCKSAFAVLSVFILYNIFFCFFHINTALNIRQFLVLSALLNLNLALLSLLLSAESTQPFFLFFVLSYAILAFIFYFFFLISNSRARYFSNLGNSLNTTFLYFFFLLPLLSLGGGAPSLAFFYKLSFLLTNLQEDSLFLLILYIFSIILSVVFYFQLFKTNTNACSVTIKSKQPLDLSQQHLLTFFFITAVLFLSTPLLGPTSYYLLDCFSRLVISLSQGL